MRLKSLVGALFLAATTALHAGCAYKSTFGEEKNETRKFYPTASAELSLKQGMYFVNAGRKIQTISVHPDDGDLLLEREKSSVRTNVNFGYEAFTPRLGLEGALGTKDIRIRIGTDARLSVISIVDMYPANGIFDKRRQTNDKSRAVPGFSFTSISPDLLTYTPYVGLEAVLAESFFLTAEVGVPFVKFKARSGYDRWENSARIVQKDSWSGTGLRIGGSIGLAAKKDLQFLKSISLVVDYEHYRPEFVGEKAEVNAIFFGLKFERWGWTGSILDIEPTRYDSHGYIMRGEDHK